MYWMKTITALAPTVASALLGPLAGAAISAIGGILGIDQATESTIKEAITRGQLTPEQLAQIKQLELKYQSEEKERGFRYAELEFKDRDSARLRDAEFLKSGRTNYRADIMFVLAVFVICALVWAIWKDPNINEFIKGIVTLVLGRFLGYLDNIYSFEFGTTRGSRDKDSTIDSMVKK